jgi:hypothetical protein
VGFVLEEMELEQDFLRVSLLSPADYHSMLLTQLSRSEVCENHDQAAHYHILGLNEGTSSLNRHLRVNGGSHRCDYEGYSLLGCNAV